MRVFQFIDSRELLKSIISQKQSNNSSFSLRGLSQKMGIKSSGYLSMILNGERRLTVSVAKKIVSYLSLSPVEQEYFLALVQFNNAKSRQQKETTYEKLKSIRYSSKVQTTVEESDFYREWYYAVLREYVNVHPTYKKDIPHIGENIIPRLSRKEVEEAFEVLESIGLIYCDTHGRYYCREKLITAGNKFDTLLLQQVITKGLDHAQQALNSIEKNRRELSSVTLSINRDTYDEILRRVANLRKEIMQLASESIDPTDVYQLNFQFFPYTKG